MDRRFFYGSIPIKAAGREYTVTCFDVEWGEMIDLRTVNSPLAAVRLWAEWSEEEPMGCAIGAETPADADYFYTWCQKNIERVRQLVEGKSPYKWSSMENRIMKGKPMELDQLNPFAYG